MPIWLGVMVNPQCLEQPVAGANFDGPKAVRAIEFWLLFVKTMSE